MSPHGHHPTATTRAEGAASSSVLSGGKDRAEFMTMLGIAHPVRSHLWVFSVNDLDFLWVIYFKNKLSCLLSAAVTLRT